MEKIFFVVLDRANSKLLEEIKKLEVRNLGAQAAINEWQIPVIIKYGKFIAARNEKDKIIGVCELIRKWSGSTCAFIHSFYISKKYRSKGIGSKLLKFVIELLQSEGFKSVSLTVSPDNIAALGLYKSAGFEVVEMLLDEYGPGTDRYLMEKKL